MAKFFSRAPLFNQFPFFFFCEKWSQRLASGNGSFSILPRLFLPLFFTSEGSYLFLSHFPFSSAKKSRAILVLLSQNRRSALSSPFSNRRQVLFPSLLPRQKQRQNPSWQLLLPDPSPNRLSHLLLISLFSPHNCSSPRSSPSLLSSSIRNPILLHLAQAETPTETSPLSLPLHLSHSAKEANIAIQLSLPFRLLKAASIPSCHHLR